MTAREVYDSVTNGGGSDFAELATILNRNKPWCLIGGLAVNCYVEPVYTIDADIVVVTERLVQILKELSAAGFAVEEFAHSVNARRGLSKLSAQFTTDPRYQRFLEGAKVMDVLGVNVPVATLENIVQGKVWAWQDMQRRSSKRKKDELDLLRIAEAHPHLRGSIPSDIVKQLG